MKKDKTNVLFYAWSEQRLLIIKNRYFYGVNRQMLGFCAQQSNGLESILKLSKRKGWLKDRHEEMKRKVKQFEKVLAFYCNSVLNPSTVIPFEEN